MQNEKDLDQWWGQSSSVASSGPCRRQPDDAGRQHSKIGAREGGVSPGGGVAGAGVRRFRAVITGAGGDRRARDGWGNGINPNCDGLSLLESKCWAGPGSPSSSRSTY